MERKGFSGGQAGRPGGPGGHSWNSTVSSSSCAPSAASPKSRPPRTCTSPRRCCPHYEKGIRECGLDFVVRVADYYGVSCDYLLGRSADRTGAVLTADDIPNPDKMKDNVYHGSVLPP